MPDRTGEPRPGRDEPPTPRLTRDELRGVAIRACHLCDDDGYRGSTVCDHVDHTQAAVRGMELVRQALAKGGDR
jgi:hypothetical protein